MGVYLPKNSTVYLYDFQLKGKRYYGSTGQKGKRAAERVEAQHRMDAALNTRRKPPITVDDAAGLYEDKLTKDDRWSTSTQTWLGRIVEALGPETLMSDVQAADVGQHFRKLAATVSGATVNRQIQVARAWWRATQRAGYDVAAEPDWGAMRYAERENDPRELSRDEEERLLASIRADYQPFVRFSLLSGWRVTEVRELLWSDVDFPAKVAWATVKGGIRVQRPLTTDMITIIASQKQACAQVFTYVCEKSRDKRKKGERYPISRDGWRKAWSEALVAAKIADFRFHDLRHTRGTRILRATGNLAAAQKALRHKNIRTTLRYAHAFDDDVRKALEASESRTIPNKAPAKPKKLRKSAA